MLEVVASLVDKSIPIREEHGPVVRYRLVETIREFGRENCTTPRNNGLSAERSRALYRASRLAGLPPRHWWSRAVSSPRSWVTPPRAHALLTAGFFALRSGDLPGAVACFEEVLDTLGVEGDVRCHRWLPSPTGWRPGQTQAVAPAVVVVSARPRVLVRGELVAIGKIGRAGQFRPVVDGGVDRSSTGGEQAQRVGTE
jgi:hypothetical protein